MTIVVPLALAFALSSTALSCMELTSNAFKPTDSDLAVAAWTYSVALAGKKTAKLSDDDIRDMVANACTTAKISVYDGIIDDLAQKYGSWATIIESREKFDPTLVFMPYKKPYAIAPEASTLIIDSSRDPKNPLKTYLGHTILYNEKAEKRIAEPYWVWNKSDQPYISPNGRIIAGLCYSEKEYRLIDTESQKMVLIPRKNISGLCLTNSALYLIANGSLYEKLHPITDETLGKEVFSYKESIARSPDRPIIRASLDGGTLVTSSDSKTIWVHRKIDGLFFTETITVPHLAQAYYFIPVSHECIIGINRNAWGSSPLENQHIIGYRPDGQPYDLDTLKIEKFTHKALASGAVSPDGKILALEVPDNGVALFSLIKGCTPQLFCTIQHIGSLIGWSNTLGQPIVCYGSKKDSKKRNAGLILIYPFITYHALARYKAIT